MKKTRCDSSLKILLNSKELWEDRLLYYEDCQVIKLLYEGKKNNNVKVRIRLQFSALAINVSKMTSKGTEGFLEGFFIIQKDNKMT